MHLVAIICLCTSLVATHDTAGELQELIECYLADFKTLFLTMGLKPKHHFLLHMPLQIIRFGPLCNQWLMRFESKKNSFKNFKFKNFKNLPLSMAKPHQMRACYGFMDVIGNKSDICLYSGDSVKEGTQVDITQEYPNLKDEIINSVNENISIVYKTYGKIIQGLKYRNGVVLLINWEINSPLLAIIWNIYVHDYKK